MPAFSDTQQLPYTPQQLYALVADIERYPEFIPWCKAARILDRKQDEVLAELLVSFSHISESYTSRVRMEPPSDARSGAIEATMVSGPFDHLVNRWTFTPEAGGTRVDFFIDFKFRSKMLDMMMGGLFGKAVGKMSGAFKTRAEALYSGKD